MCCWCSLWREWQTSGTALSQLNLKFDGITAICVHHDRLEHGEFNLSKIMLIVKLIQKVLVSSLLLSPISSFALNWMPIQWHTQNVGGPNDSRAILLIEARISNIDKSYFFQLDTGADETLLYMYSAFSDSDLSAYLIKRPEFPNLIHNPNIHNTTISIEGTIGNSPISKRPIMILKNMGKKFSPIIGTASLGIYEHPVLAIDFINNRFTIAASRNEIDEAVNVPILYSNYELSDGVPIISIFASDKLNLKVLVDTGSISALLIYDLRKWSVLTGRTLDDKMNRQRTITSLNGLLNCTIAPSLENISINNLNLGKLETEYCTTEANVSYGLGLPSDGLIGNSAFFDQAVIVFDQSKMQFGISTKN
jgi:hypothetical protein